MSQVSPSFMRKSSLSPRNPLATNRYKTLRTSSRYRCLWMWRQRRLNCSSALLLNMSRNRWRPFPNVMPHSSRIFVRHFSLTWQMWIQFQPWNFTCFQTIFMISTLRGKFCLYLVPENSLGKRFSYVTRPQRLRSLLLNVLQNYPLILYHLDCCTFWANGILAWTLQDPHYIGWCYAWRSCWSRSGCSSLQNFSFLWKDCLWSCEIIGLHLKTIIGRTSLRPSVQRNMSWPNMLFSMQRREKSCWMMNLWMLVVRWRCWKWRWGSGNFHWTS